MGAFARAARRTDLNPVMENVGQALTDWKNRQRQQELASIAAQIYGANQPKEQLQGVAPQSQIGMSETPLVSTTPPPMSPLESYSRDAGLYQQKKNAITSQLNQALQNARTPEEVQYLNQIAALALSQIPQPQKPQVAKWIESVDKNGNPVVIGVDAQGNALAVNRAQDPLSKTIVGKGDNVYGITKSGNVFDTGIDAPPPQVKGGEGSGSGSGRKPVTTSTYINTYADALKSIRDADRITKSIQTNEYGELVFTDEKGKKQKLGVSEYRDFLRGAENNVKKYIASIAADPVLGRVVGDLQNEITTFIDNPEASLELINKLDSRIKKLRSTEDTDDLQNAALLNNLKDILIQYYYVSNNVQAKLNTRGKEEKPAIKKILGID